MVTTLEVPRRHPGPAKSTPDPHWADAGAPRLDVDPSFVFELGMGSGRDGLQLTTVAADGHARHVWHTRHGWRRVAFKVTEAEVRQLATLLDRIHFLGLPREYASKDTHDGAQWIVHVHLAARDKYVYLDNAFPPPLLRLARFVTHRLVDSRPALESQGQSEPFDHDEALWRGWNDYAGCDADGRATDPGSCMPLWLTVRLQSTQGFVPGSHFRVQLVDQTTGKAITERKGSLGDARVREADVVLTTRMRDLDLDHRYSYEARVTGGKTGTRKSSTPAISYGAPYHVEVEF